MRRRSTECVINLFCPKADQDIVRETIALTSACYAHCQADVCTAGDETITYDESKLLGCAPFTRVYFVCPFGTAPYPVL